VCSFSHEDFGAPIHHKPYAPPVSGTDPRSARVGAMLGRPVNGAAAGFFPFCMVFCFSIFFWFFVSFFFFSFFLS
jgi:hypothetical protein